MSERDPSSMSVSELLSSITAAADNIEKAKAERPSSDWRCIDCGTKAAFLRCGACERQYQAEQRDARRGP